MVALRHYRQGDVLIRAVDFDPSWAQRISGPGEPVVLALGEATGHAHTVVGGAAALLEDRLGVRFLTGAGPMRVTHQEHKTLEIPAGNYRVVIQREYDPLSPQIPMRRVID